MNTAMKNLILVALFGLSACGVPKSCCVIQPQIDPTAFSDQNFSYTRKDVTPNGKRIIIVHGCVVSNHVECFEWMSKYFKIATDLAALGWQVVTFDRPGLTQDMLKDGGASYRAKYSAKLDQVLAWSDAVLGPVSENYIGGISFGGIHAMMGVALKPGVFKAYFASFSVIDIGYLTEFKGMSIPDFDPRNEVSALVSVPSYQDYGTADDRVDYTLQQDLISSLTIAGANLNVTSYPGVHHDGAPSYDGLVTWMEAQ